MGDYAAFEEKTKPKNNRQRLFQVEFFEFPINSPTEK
jgi:hypothetical protein